jgi:hypothetical protein
VSDRDGRGLTEDLVTDVIVCGEIGLFHTCTCEAGLVGHRRGVEVAGSSGSMEIFRLGI